MAILRFSLVALWLLLAVNVAIGVWMTIWYLHQPPLYRWGLSYYLAQVLLGGGGCWIVTTIARLVEEIRREAHAAKHAIHKELSA